MKKKLFLPAMLLAALFVQPAMAYTQYVKAGVQVNQAGGSTYDDTLYLTTIDILQEHFYYGWGSTTPASLDYSNIYLDNSSSFGYVETDINYDGNPELLIGENNPYTGVSTFYDVFTLPSDSAPVHLLMGGERSQIYITKDGKIRQEGSGGASDFYVTQYSINGSSLSTDFTAHNEEIDTHPLPAINKYDLTLFARP